MTASTQQLDLSAVAARLPLMALAVGISCLLSLLVILQNPLLNDDAYGYLRAAEIFNHDSARAVLESFGWYHYSILIALVDRVIPGDLVVAAHVFNTALYALLTYAFLRLSAELRDTPRARLFAALCILAFPLTNEMRYFLIRDIGFWAFALLSLVYLIRFNRNGDPQMGARWSLALIAATAFRLEGLLFMALAPCCLLLPDAVLPLRERAERCGRLVGILAALVVAVMIVALIAGFSLPELIAYAYRWYLPLLVDLASVLRNTTANVGAALFTPNDFPGSDNMAIGFAITLFAYVLALLMNFVYALSLPLVLLLVYVRLRHGPLALPHTARRATEFYIAIAALALLIFLFIMHFLTQRYATLLALLVLAWVPPALDELYARALDAKLLRRFHAWLFLFVLYYGVDSLLSFGYSHRHVEDAIAWTRAELPPGAVLKTNNFAVAYGSGRIVDYHKTQRAADGVVAESVSGDYLLLELDHDSSASFLDSYPELVELERFSNERGDQVRVYRHE